MENLHLKLEGSEHIIRTGKAPEIRQPNPFSMKGTLKSLISYINSRVKVDNIYGINPQKSIVTIDKENLTATLETDPAEYVNIKITGTLVKDDTTNSFSINGRKTFSKSELIDLLKFNKNLFPNEEVYRKLMVGLKEFVFETGVKGSSTHRDNKGNTSAKYEKEVKSDLPSEIKMSASIFKDSEPSTFMIELCMDITDGGVAFWFESVEFKSLEREMVDKEFDQLLECCLNNQLVVINK